MEILKSHKFYCCYLPTNKKCQQQHYRSDFIWSMGLFISIPLQGFDCHGNKINVTLNFCHRRRSIYWIPFAVHFLHIFFLVQMSMSRYSMNEYDRLSTAAYDCGKLLKDYEWSTFVSPCLRRDGKISFNPRYPDCAWIEMNDNVDKGQNSLRTKFDCCFGHSSLTILILLF